MYKRQSLFHEVLELFSNKLEQDSLSWTSLTKEETTARIHAAVEDAAPRLGNRILLDSAANQYLIRRLKRISTRAAWTLVQHLQQGDFVPAGYEAVSYTHLDVYKRQVSATWSTAQR